MLDGSDGGVFGDSGDVVEEVRNCESVMVGESDG